MDTTHLIEQLSKLTERKDWGQKTWPPQEGSPSVTTMLAGIFLQTHYKAILEALRRMD